jgi:hypothetical protein
MNIRSSIGCSTPLEYGQSASTSGDPLIQFVSRHDVGSIRRKESRDLLLRGKRKHGDPPQKEAMHMVRGL